MDFEQIIEKYHQALSEFHKGNPDPVLNMFSRREDVSLANPLGHAARGRAKIVDTAKRAASNYRHGEPIHFENLVTVAPLNLPSLSRMSGLGSRLAEGRIPPR